MLFHVVERPRTTCGTGTAEAPTSEQYRKDDDSRTPEAVHPIPSSSRTLYEVMSYFHTYLVGSQNDARPTEWCSDPDACRLPPRARPTFGVLQCQNELLDSILLSLLEEYCQEATRPMPLSERIARPRTLNTRKN